MEIIVDTNALRARENSCTEYGRAHISSADAIPPAIPVDLVGLGLQCHRGASAKHGRAQ